MFTKDRLIVPLMTGAANMSISIDRLASVPIQFPPLAEQQRISKLLSQTDDLRKLRAQADRNTATLLPAVFHEMFGDPPNCLIKEFRELLLEPLRNGLSPSKGGSFSAKVLTLSSITSTSYDATAWKEASFAKQPDENCKVSDNLFLICRGNGNRLLVGEGKFPSHVAEPMVFPDTIIAAVPNLDRILPAYLESVWRLPTTRNQIQAGARTTNGTFKVNQSIIERIRIPVPPLPTQRTFAQRVTEVRELETALTESRLRLDALWQSLLHRAFNGKL
jgi:type I restriction enzyme S subunit